jgi:hypothetical protein
MLLGMFACKISKLVGCPYVDSDKKWFHIAMAVAMFTALVIFMVSIREEYKMEKKAYEAKEKL